MITCDRCKQTIKLSDFDSFNGSYRAIVYLDAEYIEKHLCRDCVKELIELQNYCELSESF